MQKNPIVTILVTLTIGIGIGYILPKDTPVAPTEDIAGHHETPSMTDTMHAMNAELIGKTGDAFDRAFLTEMIVHHEGAVHMAELALTSAHHQEIKDLATAIIEAQNKEIADMQGWHTEWYGE